MRTKTYNFNYQDNHKFVNLTQQSLLQQAIDQVGIDIFYLPKSVYNEDEYDVVFREMSEKTYEEIYQFRAKMQTSFFEDGANDLFSQFGLTIEDQIELLFTQKEFWEVKQDEEYDFSQGQISNVEIDYTEEKPQIDDLIYVKQFNGKLFRIKNVDDPHMRSTKFNKGVVWHLTCQLWKPTSDDTIDVDENEFPDTQAEFIDIINQIDDDVRSKDLTEEDLKDAITQTGYDAGEGIPNKDNLNDNYEQEAKEVHGDKPYDPFKEW